MKKPKNQFAVLSPEDQKHILNLCASHTYDDAVEILRKPRHDGGLDLITSRAALCRFFTTSQQDSTLAVLAQFATAINIQHEQHANAFLGAIRATAQARVLESLRAGRALADMEKDFRFLKTAENLYLADAQWRTSNPKGARAAYQRHIDLCASAPEIDFVPVEEASAHPELTALIDSHSDFDSDIIKARERQQREAEHRAALLASFQSAITGPTPLPGPKTPAIPHIPPNSTKTPVEPPPAPASESQPAAAEPTKPGPCLSPTPKVGRNDPCPCGSGRKAKKCCHSPAISGRR